MNKRTKLLYAAFFSLLSLQAAAGMNRCVTPQGNVLLSDKPCPPGTKGESVNLPPEKSLESPIGSPPRAPYNEKEYYERISKERRLREIDFEIQAKERAVSENIEKLNRETAELQARAEELGENKLNTLAQHSLHLKIQALAEKYRTENNALNGQITSLRAEKHGLQ